MPDAGSVVVVGGTASLGLGLAQRYARAGRTVWITGRDADRARSIAAETPGDVHGAGFDLSEPETIAAALAEVGPVRYLALVALQRDQNTAREYDPAAAIRLATLKLVGYTEVVHSLVGRMDDETSILIFGGRAKDRPYPGSMTVSSVNGAVSGQMVALAVELAPIRVNAIHPGIVGDTPFWQDKPESLERVLARTPTGRLVTKDDVVAAAAFLLENRSVNGVELYVDGGWMLG